jgi:hypothetical protein
MRWSVSLFFAVGGPAADGIPRRCCTQFRSEGESDPYQIEPRDRGVDMATFAVLRIAVQLPAAAESDPRTIADGFGTLYSDGDRFPHCGDRADTE